MPRTELAVLTVVGLALFAASCNSGPTDASDPGSSAVQAYASAYIAALQADDAKALAQVIDRAANSTEVTDRLRLYGDIRQPAVTITHEFPLIYQIHLTGMGRDGQPVRISETLEWHGHWFTSALSTPEPS